MYFKKNAKTYIFSAVRHKTVRLICSKVASAPKRIQLRRHYGTLHKDKFDVLERRLREDKDTEVLFAEAAEYNYCWN
jgi:hypothetical protein